MKKYLGVGFDLLSH